AYFRVGRRIIILHGAEPMDWTEQEKLALEILKDPTASEQEWTSACELLRRRYPSVLEPTETEQSPSGLMLMAGFTSGAMSIGGGLALGVGLCTLVICLSGAAMFPYSAISAFLAAFGISLLLGFIIGVTRRCDPQEEGFRTGLVLPNFCAFVWINV